MQDFMDQLGKKLGGALDEIGKLAGDTLEIQKYKSQIHSLKRNSERDMLEMGQIVYERFRQGDIVDLDFVSFCEEIEKRELQMEELEKEIERIREL